MQYTVAVSPVLTPEFEALLGTATADTLEKLNAGAQLVHALYHCTADTITSLPDPVIRSLMRAQVAYGVGTAGLVKSATTTDPVMYVEDQ